MTITLLEDVASGQGLVAVANATEARLDQILKIDDEFVVVRNRPREGGDLILGRGVLGSDRATHLSGAELTPHDADAGGGLLVDPGDGSPVPVTGLVSVGARVAGGVATLGQILTKTIPLTDADIKGLPVAIDARGHQPSFTILPIPDSGFVNFIQALLVVDGRAGAYSGLIPDPSMVIICGGIQSSTLRGSAVSILLGSDGEAAAAWFYPDQNVTLSEVTGFSVGDFLGITLLVDNGYAEYTGGHPDNRGYLKVWYTFESLAG